MSDHVGRRSMVLAVVALLALLLPARAGATPLNLTVGTPDITASFLDFAFDSSGGLCGASYTLCYSADPALLSSWGLSPEIADLTSAYQLAATIDPATGQLVGPGTLTIGAYLTGAVVDFGYALNDGVAALEFLVDITGGSLASSFGPTLGVTGIVFNWGPLDFGQGLTTVADAGLQTDNFAPIPEPATLCLLGAGLLAVSAARLRRRRERRQ